MNRSRRTLASPYLFIFVFASLSFSSSTAFAEDPDASSNEEASQHLTLAEAESRAADQAEMRDTFLADVMQMGFENEHAVLLKRQIKARFIATPPLFTRTLEELRVAVRSGAPVGRPLKELDKLTSDVLGYFKSINMKAPQIGKPRLNDLPRTELLGEVLSIAQRVEVFLKQAVSIVNTADQTSAVSVESLQFMPAFQNDILQLRAVASRVKDPRTAVR